jgi:hypothetical protein
VPLDSNRQNLSTISGGRELNTDLSSARKGHRDKTTVRIRTKGNQYVYEEGSFAHPLYSVKNETARKHAYQTLHPDSSQPRKDSASSPREKSPEERERIQQLLFRYREEKIQKEI